MQDSEIRVLVEDILATYESTEIYADVRNGVVSLVGQVNTEEARREIEEAIAQIDGVRKVTNDLQIDFVPAEGAHLIYHPELPVELDEDVVAEGTEYDLNDEQGTTDVMESSSEAEPFFPPTDLVVRPAPETEEGFEVVGGFSGTAMDDVSEGEAPVSDVEFGDEQLADDIRRELKEDSLTTELKIRVTVRNGVAYLYGSVPSTEDADAAEEVAARVPGVVEVQENLSVQD
ncbi:MAG: BON domain-containing protein [Chloroflexota bacterium]